MGVWALIIVLIILWFLLEKVLNKLLGIEKKKISETSGKNIDRWGRGIIVVIFLCTLPFVVIQDTNFLKWYWILFLIISLGFQFILEWKYLRASKQHIMTLIYLMLGVIIMYNIEFLFQLLG